jgi:uncharacterized protein YdgA (DUF945 family)
VKTVIFMIFMLIAGAVPTAANHIGKTVEQGMRLEHAAIQQEFALSGLKIELIDYQRQLYSARATTRITIAAPQKDNAAADELVLEFKHRISHIPQPFKQVIASVDSQLVISGEAAKILTPLFNGEPPLTSHTLIFFDGHQEGTLYSPAATGPIVGSENTSVEWQGLTGSAWQSAQLDKMKFNMNMPRLVIHSTTEHQPNSFNFSNVNYQADMDRGSGTMWGGTAQMDIASVVVDISNSKGSHSINIDTIKLNSSQGERSGLAYGDAVMKAKSITVNEFNVTDVNYDVTVENLDIKALRTLQAALQEITNGTTKPAKPTQPLQPLQAHLAALYNAHPLLRINELSLHSSLGRFLLKLELASSGQWDDALLNNPALLTTMLKIDIDASVPRHAVELALEKRVQESLRAQAAASDRELIDTELAEATTQSIKQQLQGLLSLGYIKANAEQFESRLQYNAGQLTLNGIDASPLAGIMMMMSQPAVK